MTQRQVKHGQNSNFIIFSLSLLLLVLISGLVGYTIYADRNDFGKVCFLSAQHRTTGGPRMWRLFFIVSAFSTFTSFSFT